MAEVCPTCGRNWPRVAPQLSKDEVVSVLNNTAALPSFARGKRTIYEVASPRGQYCIDFASYGGTTAEVSPQVISELERDGVIERAYPNSPNVHAWVLSERKS